MKRLNENLLNDILEYITRYQVQEGVSPTFRKITETFHLPSKSIAHRYVHALKSTGKLELNSDGSISMPLNLDSSNTATVALIGEVRCGQPTAAIEDFEAMYKFPKGLTGDGDFFMLTAKGDSMIDAGIYGGDYLIIREQSTANSGDIVVALSGDGSGETDATLKRFLKKDGKFILHAENEKFDDIDFKGYKIIGKLVGSYRKY